MQWFPCLPGSRGPSAGTNTPSQAHPKTLEATLLSSAGQGHHGGGATPAVTRGTPKVTS